MNTVAHSKNPYIAAFLKTARRYFDLGPECPAPEAAILAGPAPLAPPAHLPLDTASQQRLRPKSPRRILPSVLLAAGLGGLFAGPVFANTDCRYAGEEGRTRQERPTKRTEQHRERLLASGAEKPPSNL